MRGFGSFSGLGDSSRCGLRFAVSFLRSTDCCIFACLWAFIEVAPLRAQVLMSGGSNYVQRFDSLASSGAGNAWVNNATRVGWYASKSVAPNDVTSYDADTGTSTTGAIYSFGNSPADRALGSVASNTRGDWAYGVRLLNDTGFNRTNVTVSYTGEQWRVATTNIQRLAFSFRVGLALTNADAPNSGSWNSVPALDFLSPNTNATAQAVNGNDPTNRANFAGVALSRVVVPAGQELFLRWFDTNDPDFDHGLAIDDVTVGFGEALTNGPPPEPVGGFSLVTYNVKGNFASDWSTNAAQTQAIARKMQFLNPDIVTFNEIPNGLRYQMTNWMVAFFPGYQLAISPGTDNAIRSAVMSRFSIIYSNSWFDGASLTNFGYEGTFTRDLFEAQIAVPGFPQPLHVFTTHLKSGTSSSDDAARRAAEARVISNFFANGYLTTNALQPFLLTGDMNEDIEFPATGSQKPVQALTNLTGLMMTTPLNPVTFSPLTHSIQSSNGLQRRYDYILPNRLLYSNILASQVFRTDLLNAPLPPPLLASDSATASDHLPVLTVFNNPYTKPFKLLSITRSNQNVKVSWESMPGQRYTLEQSSDLAAWATLATALIATDYSLNYTTTATNGGSFFRVVLGP